MKIDETTLIPISLVATVCGIAVWVAGVNFQTTANAESLSKFEKEYKEQTKRVEEKLEIILGKLARIESKMEGK